MARRKIIRKYFRRDYETVPYIECMTNICPKTPRNERLAWADRAFELADWTIVRLVGRDDAYGAYGDGPYTITTEDKRRLWASTIVKHFEAAGSGDVIGLHCIAPNNMCRWMAWDLDDHANDPAASARNMDAAISLCRDLTERGFDPLLESSGKGLHVWLFLERPIASRRAFLFAKAVLLQNLKLAELLNDGLIEPFPKQPSLNKDRQYGSWLRVPGLHHKGRGWSRFVDPVSGQVMEPEESVDELLTRNGDDPMLVPSEESMEWAVPKKKARVRALKGGRSREKEEVRTPETCPVPTVARHRWRKEAPRMLRCSVARFGTICLARDRMAIVAAEGVDDPAVIKNRLDFLDMLVASWDGGKPSKKRWELTDADEELLRRCEESMVEHKKKNPNAKFCLKTQMSIARYMLGVVRHGKDGGCGVEEVARFVDLGNPAAKKYVDRICRSWRPFPKGGKITKRWNRPVYPLLAMVAHHVAGKKTRRWRVVER